MVGDLYGGTTKRPNKDTYMKVVTESRLEEFDIVRQKIFMNSYRRRKNEIKRQKKKGVTHR